MYVWLWLSGDTRYMQHLDYVNLESIEDAVTRMGDGRTPGEWEAFRARQRIAHRQWFVADPLPWVSAAGHIS